MADQTWKDLVCWVQKKGGYVNEALVLTGNGPSRGVCSHSAIPKGKLLIRLPSSCVLDGSSIKATENNTSSPWLRCVAAFYRAYREEKEAIGAGGRFGPFLQSLPGNNQYETLFQWTDAQIKKYLGGTALGIMVQHDRKNSMFRLRYDKAVKPLLAELGLFDGNDGNEDEEIDKFRQACMCISTRGFNLRHKAGMNDSSAHPKYSGPFLLPIIDLLNHDDENPCTTLERDDKTGDFLMIAERDILRNEEVVHSYGNEMTSAQILQTFGFVPAAHTMRAITLSQSSRFTSALLSKRDHLLSACREVKSSGFPERLQQRLQLREISKKGLGNDDDDSEDDEPSFWRVSDLPDRALSNIPDDILVAPDLDGFPDELCTLLSAQFLSDDVYEEIFDPDTLLDVSALEDFYLGNLVCSALLKAVRLKMKEYFENSADSTEKEDLSAISRGLNDTILSDKELLKRLVEESKGKNDIDNVRATYGLTVKTEELMCLQLLVGSATKILEKLDGQCPKLPPKDDAEAAAKRQKTEP